MFTLHFGQGLTLSLARIQIRLYKSAVTCTYCMPSIIYIQRTFRSSTLFLSVCESLVLSESVASLVSALLFAAINYTTDQQRTSDFSCEHEVNTLHTMEDSVDVPFL